MSLSKASGNLFVRRKSILKLTHLPLLATAEVVCRELGCGHVLKWERLLGDGRLFTQTVGASDALGKKKRSKLVEWSKLKIATERHALYSLFR